MATNIEITHVLPDGSRATLAEMLSRPSALHRLPFRGVVIDGDAFDALARIFGEIGRFTRYCRYNGWCDLPDYASHRCAGLTGADIPHDPMLGYTGAHDVAPPLGCADSAL